MRLPAKMLDGKQSGCRLPGSLARRFSIQGRVHSILKGDRRGQWSLRINDQWRLCFRWEDGDAHEVGIVDYH